MFYFDIHGHREGVMNMLRRLPGPALPPDVPLGLLKGSGVGGLALCVIGDPSSFMPIKIDPYRGVIKDLEVTKKIAIDAGGSVALDPTDLEAAAQNGGLGFVLGIEGGDFLKEDLVRLDTVFARGARLLVLVHYSKNKIGSISYGWGGRAIPASERTGLTGFGKAVIARANELGMIIDLAHADEETIAGALDCSSSPMLCSHTGPRALQDFPRYISDVAIRGIAKAGGLIGLWTFFNKGRGVADLRTFAEYAAHCAEIAGSEHIAIGSDVNGVPGNMAGYGSILDSSRILEALAEKGFSESEIAGIAGLNFLRFYKGLNNL